eukprot:CAMPEP_0113907594 /NCGR_PEP_ID=MMETSP0780_2-20120614/25577_1 /TAXON_ID=652834 /ORGANISM="Palpitomonas bilix" /LENGTH=508 /DNA_ID=CAMNT_0000902697 /DNA_START=256 /DNA_END=1778 /DNA_ORIENTATION=+ /assembly_acc=CAM_ASM_000599
MIVSATTAGAKKKPKSIFRDSLRNEAKVYPGSILCVPVVGEAGETLAVIQLVSPSSSTFSPDVQYRLAMVAAQASAAFQNATHFQKLWTTKTFMRSVMDELSTKEVVAKITESVKATMKAFHATVYLYHPRHDLLQAYVGDELAFLSSEKGIAGAVATKGEPILSNSLSTDTRFDHSVDALFPSSGMGHDPSRRASSAKSSTVSSASSAHAQAGIGGGGGGGGDGKQAMKLLSVPLLGHGLKYDGEGEMRFGVIGVVSAVRNDIPFSGDDKQVLMDIAAQASIALSISRRYEDGTDEARMEASVLSSSLSLLRTRDVQTCVREAKQMLKHALHADYASFFFADTTHNRLIQRADKLVSDTSSEEDGLVLPWKGLAAECVSESDCVRVSHIARDSRFSAEVDALSVPVEKRETLLKRGKHYDLASSVTDFVYPLISIPVIDSTGKVVLGVMQAYGKEGFVSALPRQTYAALLNRGKGAMSGDAVVQALIEVGAAFNYADELAGKRLARV